MLSPMVTDPNISHLALPVWISWPLASLMLLAFLSTLFEVCLFALGRHRPGRLPACLKPPDA